MAKVVVPAHLEEESRADDRLAGRECQCVDNLASAMGLLAEGAADAVFLGGQCECIDRDTYEAVTKAFSGFSRPVVLLSADARAIWSNDLAESEGVSAAQLAGAPITASFDEIWRNSFMRALAHCARQRTVVRTIISRRESQYELTLIPAGEEKYALTAAVFGNQNLLGSLAGRVERLAMFGAHLFPEDSEAVVRLPHEERIALIKGLIEKTVREVFEFDDFIVRTLDPKTGALEAIIARSGSGVTISKRVLYANVKGNSVAGYVGATGKPYLVEDSRSEPLWIGDLMEIRSAVVVPLRLGEKVMGTFAIEKKEEGAYDRYDIILASIFAGYIAAVLDLADLVGLGQKVLVDRVAESVVEEASQPLKTILDDLEELRRQNIGDSIAIISRLESIRASVGAIRDSIMKGAKKVGAAVTAPPIAADETLAGKKVLIADDEPSILQSLGDILKGSGCVVEFAHDGLEAVELATKSPYDLVISDIKMPKMSGYEVYASIKSTFAETSVILMTAYGYDPTHSIVRARQEGLEAVLYKPFRAETLKKTLRQALQKKAAK